MSDKEHNLDLLSLLHDIRYNLVYHNVYTSTFILYNTLCTYDIAPTLCNVLIGKA